MIDSVGVSRHVDANGWRHHLLVYGAEDSPPLLLLPGITSPALTAEFVAVRLADRFAVHTVDFRGRGRTPPTTAGTYTLDEYAADIAGLVESLSLDSPILLGHSMGARIAAAYATRERAHSGPVLLVDPPLSGPGRDPYPTSFEDFAAQLDQAYAGATAGDIRKWYPAWDERELAIRAQELPTCDRLAVLESHVGFHREDFFAYWERLRPPAVLIYGERSPVVQESGVDDLRRANEWIPLVAIPDAGHMVPWDNLEGFMGAVDAFLATDPAVRTASEGEANVQ